MCVGKYECIWEDLSKCSVESILEGQGSGQMSCGLWVITAGPLQNEHHTPVWWELYETVAGPPMGPSRSPGH